MIGIPFLANVTTLWEKWRDKVFSNQINRGLKTQCEQLLLPDVQTYQTALCTHLRPSRNYVTWPYVKHAD